MPGVRNCDVTDEDMGLNKELNSHASMSFIKCIKEGIKQDPELKEELYSLILFGSFVRGDFLEGVSDLDFFAVIVKRSEKTIPKLKRILEECTQEIKATEVDLAWEYLKNLDDPLRKGYPFKFLTIYQEDFLKNHKVVYGKGIEDILPKYDWRKLVKWRAERILNSLERRRGDLKMLHISAGEVARFLAFLGGAKTLEKKEVLETLRKIGDGKALEIYQAYLDGRKLKFNEETLVNFISSRIMKVLDRGEI